MGNQKSGLCGLPVCGAKDDQVSSMRRNNKNGKNRFRKNEFGGIRGLEAKNTLRQMLEEETFQRFEVIKV